MVELPPPPPPPMDHQSDPKASSQGQHRDAAAPNTTTNTLLSSLGVQAHTSQSIEAALQTRATRAFQRLDKRISTARLDKLYEQRAQLEERLVKCKSTARIEKLVQRLEEVNEEIRGIVEWLKQQRREGADVNPALEPGKPRGKQPPPSPIY